MSLSGGVTPGFYVARDRARRFGRVLEQALQDRRLAYRADVIGLASLGNEAVRLLETLVKEAETSVDDVLAQRVRDRERGWSDVPFVVMTEGLLERARLVLALERARTAKRAAEAPTQAAILEVLDEAARRVDAFCAVYDEKRPLAVPRTVDLGRLLQRVERDARLAREGRPPVTVLPAASGSVPEVTSVPDALEDLVRAARAALPLAPGPWRVVRGSAGEPLRLLLGEQRPDDAPLPLPPRLDRAQRVLAHAHAASVVLRGRPVAPHGTPLDDTGPARRDWGAAPHAPPAPEPEAEAHTLELRIPDPAAGGEALSAAAGAGEGARLAPEAEKAVRALLAAPALPEGGAPPPQRTIALLGVLRALDAELLRVFLPRLAAGDLRAAARLLPREVTRKAALKPDLLEAVRELVPEATPSRLEDLVEDLAQGKAGRKRANAADAALLLATFGRTFTAGGFKAVAALPLAPWTEADVPAAIADLRTIAEVRRVLETGQGVESAVLARLERAAVATLGRLGRLLP